MDGGNKYCNYSQWNLGKYKGSRWMAPYPRYINLDNWKLLLFRFFTCKIISFNQHHDLVRLFLHYLGFLIWNCPADHRSNMCAINVSRFKPELIVTLISIQNVCQTTCCMRRSAVRYSTP